MTYLKINIKKIQKSFSSVLSFLDDRIYFKNSTIFIYIFKELLLYFSVSFLFFFFIFFVNQILLIADEILSKKAPLADVLLLLFYYLPLIIATTAPYAALVGTLMCLGRFSADYEFISMKALGISTAYILVPVFSVGVLISVVSFITNDILIPTSSIKINEVFYKIAASTPALELESYAIKRNENSTVVAGLIKDKTIHDLLVIDSSQRDSKRFIASGKTKIEKSNNIAILMQMEMQAPRLLNLDMTDSQKFDVAYGESIFYNILAKDVMSKYTSSSGPDKMTSRDLIHEIREKRALSDYDPRYLNIYVMELHRKFAIPFGALFFVVFAFAISQFGKTYDQSVGFIVGLLISVVYWALLIGGQVFCLDYAVNLNGGLVMWFPNIVLVVVTALLGIKKVFK